MPVELSNASARAIIYPEFGGMLNDLFLKTVEGEVALIYGYKEGESISDMIHVDFRNVKLSPFPNRIENGKYSFDGLKYQLPINFPQEGNSIHGLVYDKPFNVVLQTTTQLVLEYKLMPSLGYPFSFRLILEYVLLGRSLVCKTKIENLGTVSIPIADGFHPYFTFNGSIDDVKLQLPKVKQLEVNARLIPTGEFTDFSEFDELKLIGKETKFDTGFEILSDSNIVETSLVSDKVSLKVRQEVGEGKYNFLQVYIPNNRKSIAIEPMTAAANAFNNKIGLMFLLPKEKKEMNIELVFNLLIRLLTLTVRFF